VCAHNSRTHTYTHAKKPHTATFTLNCPHGGRLRCGYRTFNHRARFCNSTHTHIHTRQKTSHSNIYTQLFTRWTPQMWLPDVQSPSAFLQQHTHTHIHTRQKTSHSNIYTQLFTRWTPQMWLPDVQSPSAFLQQHTHTHTYTHTQVGASQLRL